MILCGESSAELVMAYVAALRAGLVVVPVNAAYTRAEVSRIVVDATPAAAAVGEAERGRWVEEASNAPVIITGLRVDVDLSDGRDDAAIDLAQTEDPAVLVYTSGTTGRPKGAPLTHGNLLSSATAVGTAWRWEPEDTLLLTLPLFHVHGLGVGINGSLCAGASVILRPRFEVADVIARCAAGEASMFFGVPTMYQRIAESGQANALQRLRLFVSGSAPLAPSLATAIGEAAGALPLERYGMTETIMLTTNPYEGPRKPGTVGFPFPGVEVRLARPSAGATASPGAGAALAAGAGAAASPGAGPALAAGAREIQVRGPNVISGYFNQPQATAEAFTADGWFRTGDLGERDEDGYLRIVGRSKDLIITGGYNVHPREVEEALLSHPAVREAAVVGRADDTWGEAVTAVIVADGTVGPEDLRAHAAHQLASYKVPKTVEFVDELPRNALGKLLREQLR